MMIFCSIERRCNSNKNVATPCRIGSLRRWDVRVFGKALWEQMRWLFFDDLVDWAAVVDEVEAAIGAFTEAGDETNFPAFWL